MSQKKPVKEIIQRWFTFMGQYVRGNCICVHLGFRVQAAEKCQEWTRPNTRYCKSVEDKCFHMRSRRRCLYSVNRRHSISWRNWSRSALDYGTSLAPASLACVADRRCFGTCVCVDMSNK